MDSKTTAVATGLDPIVKTGFHVSGSVHLENFDQVPADLNLIVCILDTFGNSIGVAEVDQRGHFDVSTKLNLPADFDLFVGMAGDVKNMRKADAFLEHFTRENWVADPHGGFHVSADINIRKEIISLWSPVHVLITGNVRKVIHDIAGDRTVPVPFVKLEFFDVDRDPYLWPILKPKLPVIANRKVIPLENLLKADAMTFSIPTPEELGRIVMLNPQPEPPIGRLPLEIPSLKTATKRLGDLADLTDAEAAQVDSLTVTSFTAPWVKFPRYFYSKRLIATVFDDTSGTYRCEFNWYPLHFRNGRLRFDRRPDIIVRLTQIIDGVEHFLYMDPYCSTRWNVSTANIDFYLDDPAIFVGSGASQERPVGAVAFISGIGLDDAYRIDQTTGLYHDTEVTNMAYGYVLYIRAQFGDILSWRLPLPGANPPYYYRLSYSADGTTFTPISTPLTDRRVQKYTTQTQTVTLGPTTVGTQSALYEVRDFGPYLWYNPDDIGIWDTRALAEGKYTLRMEMFDASGTRLTSAFVDYRDGSATVSPLPPMNDHCDLMVAIDNTPVTLQIAIPDASGDCGVVKTTSVAAISSLDINVAAWHPRNRINECVLYYTKGLNGAQQQLEDVPFPAGTGTFTDTIDAVASHMFTGLTTTCGFATWFGAWAHIRNGYGRVYYSQLFKPMVIDIG